MRKAGNGRPWRGRARVERHPRACGGTPDLLCLSCRGAPAEYSRIRWRAWRRSASRSQDGRRRPFQCVSYRTAVAPPRPRTEPVAKDLVDLQTLDGHGDVVCGDVKGGDLVVELLKTYWVSPAGRFRKGRLCRGGWCRVCIGLPRLGSGRQGPACCWGDPSIAIVGKRAAVRRGVGERGADG